MGFFDEQEEKFEEAVKRFDDKSNKCPHGNSLSSPCIECMTPEDNK